LQSIEYQERAMLSRRGFLAGSATALAAGWPRPLRAQAILTEDGLYKQPWFLESLLEFSDDLAAATANKKRFAIMWELKGCPYCKKTHETNFARPEIESYIKQRFEILQLNIIGAREVTDFDGEKMPEKQLAAKYGVRYTPTTQFFPEDAAGLGARKPQEREVARTVGYQEPREFLGTYKYVAERAYEKGPLQDYLKANS
jgi:thioredoxin-related protein